MPRRVLVLTCLLAALSQAAVTRVEITERTDGPIPGSERVSGKIYFAVDPKLAANHGIADIELAPRNAAGMVEFSADLRIFRMKDAAKSNGTAFLEIANRGTTPAWNATNIGNDGFLLQQGFTVVWVGWQFDVTGGNNIKLYVPVISGLTGPVRAEILVNQKATSQTLPYAVAETSTSSLTVRDHADGPRMVIARDQWSVTDQRLDFPSGFEPGRIYDFVYTGKDPAVAGLGMAAVRDYVSYMKQQGDVKQAIGMGISQSGRFLRTFLADGFNADEKGKKVFEGVWAHVAGAGHGDFNQRFAQPSKTTGQFGGIFFPTDLPPFNPDELLADVTKAGMAPKLFLTWGSHEYWGRAAGLNHITADGTRDVEPGPDTRIYYVAGTQHGTGTGAEMKGLAQNRNNPMDWAPFMRATAVSLNAWITTGTVPPPSVFPHISKDEFVTVSALNFPRIPGIKLVHEAYAPRRLDFGPEFLSSGIVAFEPPKVGDPFPALVPQVDHDGNEISGIRLPELRFPLATYTGWNLRDPAIGAPTEQYALTGSMIPLPRTVEERMKTGDPRLSIAERYTDQAAYLAKIEAAAHELAKNRFLLESDVPHVVAHAKQQWETLAAQ